MSGGATAIMLGSAVQAMAPWCLAVFMLAILGSQLRLARGPTRADRVLALDLVTILAAGALGVIAAGEAEPAYLSVALVIALISFLATVAFSFYVEHQSKERSRHDR